jgi:hypothetical protein
MEVTEAELDEWLGRYAESQGYPSRKNAAPGLSQISRIHDNLLKTRCWRCANGPRSVLPVSGNLVVPGGGVKG